MLIVITWLAVAIVALVFYLRQTYSTLSNAGVNHLPVVPFFGNFFWIFINKEHLSATVMRIVNAFPEDQIVGYYEMLNPMYMIRDLETMKKATVKDFEHFVDRKNFTSDFDLLFSRGLINLKGNEWKEMRSTLSPAFTSSKIRLMVPLMVEVGQEMIKLLNKTIKDSEKQYIDVELKDLTTRYANDVIASCAFGLKVDSHSDNNQFYLKSKEITTFSLIRVLKVLLFTSLPGIGRMLRIRISAPTTSSFFEDVVLTTMKDREKRNIIRHDMINILNEVRRGNISHEETEDITAGFATIEESVVSKKTYNKSWTDIDLVAQAVLFLFAGFDTVSTEMTFILYKLANQQNVQDRLVEEIKENDAKSGGKFDFNSIQSMKYMDMVVSECLRLYPAAAGFDRQCVKDYNFGRINKTSTKDLIVRKGDVVVVPVWAFHRDPELFPNPDKFDPERFSDENKHNIKPYSYMPFGVGPRNCIGSRFALCEIKVMLYQLLRTIKVVPCEKTTYPPKLVNGFNMHIKNGAWVRFKIRDEYDNNKK